MLGGRGDSLQSEGLRERDALTGSTRSVGAWNVMDGACAEHGNLRGVFKPRQSCLAFWVGKTFGKRVFLTSIHTVQSKTLLRSHLGSSPTRDLSCA